MLGAVAIGEEPIVPDPHEALGEHVEQEAADKLLRGEAHHFGLVPMRVVSVVEADLAVLAVQDALVANGDPMGIAPEVAEHRFGTAEGGLGVDHPALGSELGEEHAEGRGLCKRGGLSGEVELSCLEGLLQRLEVFRPEHHGERPHREKEPALGGDPPPIGGERTAADHTVHMQVLTEILAPGVEHHRDPDLAPEPLGIPTEGLQGLRGRLKQEVVDHLRVSLGDRVDLMGQGEDQMEIGHRQELGRACLDPALLGQRLAFWAVAVAAGVVTRHFCAAVITHFQMATEGRRTAVLDGLHHAALLAAESMGAPVRLPLFPEDLRQLHPAHPGAGVCGPAHGSGTGLWSQQEIEWRSRVLQMPLREVEIAHRGREVSVPEETLDAVEIHP